MDAQQDERGRGDEPAQIFLGGRQDAEIGLLPQPERAQKHHQPRQQNEQPGDDAFFQRENFEHARQLGILRQQSLGDGKYLREIVINVPFDRNTARAAIGNKPAEDVKGTQAPGAPWAICITPGPKQVLYSADAYPGRVYKLSLDGKVLGVLGEAGKQLKQFGWIHEMACPSENELYVAEVLNWRVQKLILYPDQQLSALTR